MNRLLASLALAAGLAAVCGCEGDGGGSGGDVGANDRNLVICMGDSITQGYACDGAPYPSQLAALSGKNVVNAGAGGVRASAGASGINAQLARHPGYICILYGANDAIAGGDPNAVGQQIAAMVAACRANQTIPIVATTPPMIGSHALYDGAARSINDAIRAAASAAGARVVDLYGAFGSGEAYLVSDGLHPNAAGAALIAKMFLGAM